MSRGRNKQKQKQKQKKLVVKAAPTEHLSPTKPRTQLQYSGPMPMASEAERYEALSPGATARMLDYADQQQNHRQGLENRVVDSNIKLAHRGQGMGFAIGVLGIVAATYLISTGFVVAGIAVFFGDIGSLVGVFVYGRREATKEKVATLERVEPLGVDGSARIARLVTE